MATGPMLGTNRDSEGDGTHSANANADDSTGSPDDEDGVTFGTIRVGALGVTATVNVQNAPGGAKLDAWIDFNGDGSWDGVGEQIADSVAVANGTNTIHFNIPSDANAGTTFARFRLSTAGHLGTHGPSADGEVEDYTVTITPPMVGSGIFVASTVASGINSPYQVTAQDIDGDGFVDLLSPARYDNEIVWFKNDGSQNFTRKLISNAVNLPYSAVAADVDGDGDVDVVSASFWDNRIAWYENDGDENFTQHTISDSANGATFVVASDLDQDGDVDVVSTQNDGVVSWFENDGLQNFTQHVISSVSTGARGVDVADVDSDGDLDVIDAATSSNLVEWHENNGSQVFTQHTLSNSLSGAFSVVAGDVDGDGDTDIVVAAALANSVVLFSNNGSETFTSTVIDSNSSHAKTVVMADIDGDTDVDFVVGSRDDNRVTAYLKSDSSGYTPLTISTTASGVASVAVADVDRDGVLDVLSANEFGDDIIYYRQLVATDFGDAPAPYPTTLAENGARHIATGPRLGTHRDFEINGTHSATANADDTAGSVNDEDGVTFGTIRLGSLGVTATVNVQNAPGGAKLDAWIDFDGDGNWGGPLERIAENFSVSNGTNSLTFDIPSWSLPGATVARFRISTSGTATFSGLASDGEVEDYQVIISPAVAGSGIFQATQTITSAVEQPEFLFAIDLDRDGDTDVIVPSAVNGEVAWYENNGNEVFTKHLLQTNVVGATKVFAEDIDGDGDLDVIATLFHDGVVWYENDGNQGFTTRTVSTNGGESPRGLFVADIEGDGDRDIFSATRSSSNINWHENDGAESFTTHAITNQAQRSYGVIAADVDGDGFMDLASASLDDNKFAWYENDGAQVFTQHVIDADAAGAFFLASSDIDLDGDLDFAGAAIFGDVIVWYENDGTGTFSKHILSSTATRAGSVFPADIDGDGDVDIAATFQDTVVWFQNDGAQTFTQHTVSSTEAGATSVFVTDVDGDGVLDFVASASTGNKVVWYRQQAATVVSDALDFGDAPDTSADTGTGNYQTLLSNGGPSHNIATTRTTLFLGAGVDSEADATPNNRANGDDITASPDDENGLIEPAQDLVLTVGAAPVVRVRATNTTGAEGTLYGWIDFNRDGVFDNSTERTSVTIPDSTTNGTFLLTFPMIPADASAGATYARFRLSTDVAAANSTGAATDGEVEDYAATITLRSSGTADSTKNVKLTSGTNGAPTLANDAFFGSSLASLGDMDGDGITDLAVGATGAVYVQFMNSNGTVKSFVKLDGIGGPLASLGDLDGDGVTDLAAGGGVVVFLNSDGTVKSSVTNGFSGSSVASLGDLDGDGVTDLAVGVLGSPYDPASSTVSVLLLKADGTVKSSVILSSGVNGAPTLGPTERFGNSLASLGDIDGDGVTDLAAGVVNNDTIYSARGFVSVMLLNSDGTVKSSVKIANETNGGPTLGQFDYFGSSLASLGDIDGDGVTDLAVWDPIDFTGVGTYRGAVHVLLLNSDGTAKSSVRIASGTNGGPTLADFDFFGRSLASLGDLDGDGVTDLAVGAPSGGNSSDFRGAVHVLFLNPLTVGGATVAIAASNASQAEGHNGNTPFTFTVTRTGDTSGTSSLNFAVTGSGIHPADATDFGGTLPSGTVSFAVGEASQTITINVSGDTTVESDESFTVTLSPPTFVMTSDLNSDWSEVANPNGVWTYQVGSSVLPHFEDVTSVYGFSTPQTGWAELSNPYSGAWIQNNGSYDVGPSNDVQAGDIMAYADQTGSGGTTVVWTSPGSGSIDVLGSVWPVNFLGRSSHWSVLFDGQVLSEGDIFDQDITQEYTRSHPFDFSTGSGGAAVLQNIDVTAGDTISLRLSARSGSLGDFVGVNLTVNLTQLLNSGATITTATATGTILDDDFVNHAPSFTAGPDQTVSEDIVGIAIADWATNLSTGASDESGQTLSFLVSNDNTGLFSVQPSIDESGTLTFTPAADANGSATVTVRLHDDGGTANGGQDTSDSQTFTINVIAVNDAPTISPIARQVVSSGQQHGVLFAISDVDSDHNSLTVTATSSNPNLVPAESLLLDTSNELAELLFTTTSGVLGASHITLTVSDGALSSSQQFDVVVPFVELISVADPALPSATPAASSDSGSFAISSDGRYVAFHSSASNLVAGDTNEANDVFVKDLTTGIVMLVSSNSDGIPGNSSSEFGSLVVDGNGHVFVAFRSYANNLVATETQQLNIYLKDLTTGTTTLVSSDSDGVPGNDASFVSALAVDDDGHLYVAFASFANNLVASDSNGKIDIFLKDITTGITTLVSTDSFGTQGNSHSVSTALAVDSSGHVYVLFESAASNLVSGDTNNSADVFVKDVFSGETTRVSTDSDGMQGNFESGSCSIAVDESGHVYVAFISYANNLVANDTNNRSDAFVKDLATGVTTLISSNSNGEQGNDASFTDTTTVSLAIDGTGHVYVAFSSFATNLVPGDTNERSDVFVKELTTGTTTLASSNNVGIQGNADSPSGGFGPSLAIDASGQILVAFASAASNLGEHDFNLSDDVFVKNLTSGTTTLVSTAPPNPLNRAAASNSLGAAVSRDGRYVAFTSFDSNLVAGDTNNATDVFVRDRATGTTTLVSTTTDGSLSAGAFDVATPSLAVDIQGHVYVVFSSNASNLVDGDTNGTSDVFVKDLTTGITTRVSTDSNGQQGNDPSGAFNSRPAIAIDNDGHIVVAFSSHASNLVPDDTNDVTDIFVKNLTTGITTRVSTGSNGAQGNLGSGEDSSPSLAVDGHGNVYVAFVSWADNFVAADTNQAPDVFVKNVTTGATVRVNTSSSGEQANGFPGMGTSPSLAVDGDGRVYVAFSSGATNLVAGDTNGFTDVFVKDLTSGITTRVSTDSQGNAGNFHSSDFSSPSLAVDGNGHLYVAFASNASNLVAGDNNNATDVFVKDLTGPTTLVSTDSSEHPGNFPSSVMGQSPALAVDASGHFYVAFSSFATNLVAGDLNGQSDVFLFTGVINNAPSISSIADQSLSPGQSTGAIPFTVSDSETAAANLIVTVTSSNPNAVPLDNIVIEGNGTERTIAVTSNNTFGRSRITVSVSDGVNTRSTQFTVNQPSPFDAAYTGTFGGEILFDPEHDGSFESFDLSFLDRSLLVSVFDGVVSAFVPGFFGVGSSTLDSNGGFSVTIHGSIVAGADLTYSGSFVDNDGELSGSGVWTVTSNGDSQNIDYRGGGTWSLSHVAHANTTFDGTFTMPFSSSFQGFILADGQVIEPQNHSLHVTIHQGIVTFDVPGLNASGIGHIFPDGRLTVTTSGILEGTEFTEQFAGQVNSFPGNNLANGFGFWRVISTPDQFDGGQWNIFRDEPTDQQLRLSDAGGVYDVVGDGGDVVIRAQDGTELFRNFRTSIRTLSIIGGDGDDTVILHADDALTLIGQGFSVSGGGQGAGGDAVQIVGNLPWNSANYAALDSDASVITANDIRYDPMTGIGVFRSFRALLSGVEQVRDELVVLQREISLSSAADQNIEFSDAGNSSDGFMRLASDVSHTSLTFRLPSIAAALDPNFQIARLNVSLGDGADRFETTSTDNALEPVLFLVFGNAGDDQILNSGLSHDQLFGGEGNDTLVGGAGNSLLDGETGNNSLVGGAGNDTLSGGNSDTNTNTLEGGEGIDEVFAAGGDATPFTMTLSNTQLLFDQAEIATLNSIETAHLILQSGEHFVVDASAFTGNSQIEVSSGEGATVSGGVGNDILSVFGGSAVFFGGAGDDSLTGGFGDDVLDGGEGNDTVAGGFGNDMLTGGSGNDVLDGGEGDDLLDGGNGTDIVTATGDVDFVLRDDQLTGLGIDTLISIEHARLTGGFGNNFMNAISFTLGSVTLDGADGDDRLFGSVSDDELIGGSGNDILGGWFGNDLMSGGDGDDSLTGFDGNDTVLGGAGNDELTGGTSRFNGDEGHDPQNATDGDDSLDGGDGIDTLFAAGDFDLVLTNTLLVGPRYGEDSLTSIENANLSGANLSDDISGNNVLDASAFTLGSVTMRGGAGNDTLLGGSGNDQISGDAGSDVLVGGDGNDVVFDDLDPDGDDSIDGGNGNDFLSGGVGNDTVRGGAGNDTLYNLDGDNDWLDSSGGDLLDGGDGTDELDVAAFFSAQIVVLSDSEVETRDANGGVIEHATLANIEFVNISSTHVTPDINASGFSGNTQIVAGNATSATIIGGSGPDVVFTGEGDDFISVGNGNDSVFSGGGNDTVFGGAGNDVLEANDGNDNLDGGAGNDLVVGRNGDDILSGGDGNDLIDGGTGNDLIDGGADDDTLQGEEGDDQVLGGLGDDVLGGGPGNNVLDGGEGFDLLLKFFNVNAVSTLTLTDSSLIGIDLDDFEFVNDTLSSIEAANLQVPSVGPLVDAGSFHGRLSAFVNGNGNHVATLIGGFGDDQLTSDGSAFGGDGNDTISAPTGFRVDGGAGYDRLELFPANEIDLTLVPADQVTSIEELDPFLSHVILNQETVLNFSGPENLLTVTRDFSAFAVVTLADLDDWTQGAFERTNGRTLAVFTQGDATLKVHVSTQIQGQVWNDLNGDGILNRDPETNQPLEPGLPGRTVFVDLNHNSLFDSGEPVADSLSDGSYLISDTPIGEQTIRQVLPPGLRETHGTLTVVIPPGGLIGPAVLNADFGSQVIPPTELRGVVWDDRNANGSREFDEPGLAGVTVFLDANHNGELNDGEFTTLTAADDPATTDVDESGTYRFTNVDPGTYVVREQTPAGAILTFPEIRGLNDPPFNSSLFGSRNVSADGRYEVFASDESNLVAGDTNSTSDIFRRDTSTGDIVRVNVAANGTEANLFSFEPAISADGRFVAFTSFASNLVSDSIVFGLRVFVKNLETGAIESFGDPLTPDHSARGPSHASLSADGRYVVFAGSDISNVVAHDTNRQSDVFVADRETGVIERISVRAGGLESNFGGFDPAISDDGRYVVFVSASTNLVSVSPTFNVGLFITDRVTGETKLLFEGRHGTPSGASLSHDGQFIRFGSDEGVSRVLANPFLTPGSDAPNFVVTVDVGQVVSDLDFGNFTEPFTSSIQGVVFDDLNGNHNRDIVGTSEIVSGDIATNVAVIRLAPFTQLTLSTTAQVPVSELDDLESMFVIEGDPLGLVNSVNFDIPDITDDVATVRFNVAFVSFGLFETEVVSLRLSRFVDAQVTVLSAQLESGLPGRAVFLDQNNNGVLDVGESSVLTAEDDLNTSQDKAGTYSFTGLASGLQAVVEQLPIFRIRPNEFGLISATNGQFVFGPRYLRVGQGEALNGVDFGDLELRREIHGTQWLDDNANGIRDPDESGLAGITIYLDLNHNGSVDDGEPTTLTAEDDPATTDVDETGRYQFVGLLPGNYDVREVVLSGFRTTFAPSIQRVDVPEDETLPNGRTVQNSQAQISGDGRFVVFFSDATNFVPNDTNGAADVFVKDLQTGVVTRVSVASDGTQANSDSYFPAISANGRFVVFTSDASNLVSDDTNGFRIDTFVKDLLTGVVERIANGPATGNTGEDEYSPSISGDGRYVVFLSGDFDSPDVVLYDRQTGTSRILGALVDFGGSADPTISASGEFVDFHNGLALNLSTGEVDDTPIVGRFVANEVEHGFMVTDLDTQISLRLDVPQFDQNAYGGFGLFAFDTYSFNSFTESGDRLLLVRTPNAFYQTEVDFVRPRQVELYVVQNPFFALDALRVQTLVSISVGDVLTGVDFGSSRSTVTAVASIASAEATEGSGVVFTITLSNALDVESSVTFSTSNGTATTEDGDYSAISAQTVVFAAGTTSQTVTVHTIGDDKIEAHETFTSSLSALSGGRITVSDTEGSATGTINNDDTQTLSISSPTVTEGTGGTKTLTFTVTSASAVQGGFTVAFSNATGTAGANDFSVTTASPLTFTGTANETQTISVDIGTDAIIEANEQFTVTLGTVSAATATQSEAITTGAVGTGTINNDDVETLTISSPTVTEGTGGTKTLTFTVTSASAVQGGFTVAFSNANGTAGDGDYSVTTSSPLTFTGTANETKTISVNIATDAIIEANEQFTITLGTIAGTTATQSAAITTGAVGTGTINNDDVETLTISSPTVSEGTGGTKTLTFTVTSASAVQGGFTVAFGNATGTAGADDFSVTTSSPLTFMGTVGETRTISVDIATDAVIEANEQFTVTLGTVAGATATQIAAITTGAVGTGTINNDDVETLTITSPTITEGTGGTSELTFTVTSSNAVQGGFSVAFRLADVTTDGSDHAAFPTGSLAFTGAAGETHTITVTVNGDTLPERTETLTATLETVTGTTATQITAITTGAVGTGSIANDDMLDLVYTDTNNVGLTASVVGGRVLVKLNNVSQPQFDPEFVRTITITGGTKDDTIDLTGLTTGPQGAYSHLTSIVLVGGAGIDRITGSDFDETITGGVGNDILDGKGGTNTLVETGNVDFTLSNTALTSSAGNDTLSHFQIANLTGGVGANTFTVTGWTGSGTIDGSTSPGNTVDRIVAVHDTNMTLTDTSLASAGFGTLTLAGIEAANLTGGASANTFDVSGWTHAAILVGGGGADTIAATKDVNFTLSNTGLQTSDGMNVSLNASFLTANLTGGDSANTFTVSGWTRTGTFAGGGGGDTIAATKNTSFTLADSGLQTGDGMNLSLDSEFTIANLTGGAAANTFTVSGWTHDGTLVGGGGPSDTIVAIKDVDFTLTNTGLHASDGMSLAFDNNFTTANLTGGASENTFTVSAWTHAGRFAGGGGDDTIEAIKNASFTLSNTGLQTTDGMSLTLNSDFTTANLTGGVSANTFTVSGWTRAGTFVGGGGGDTIAATKNVDFTITNSGLHTTDGMNLSLNSDFTVANLTGGASANSFTVTGWTGTGTITGLASAAGTFDQIVAAHDTDMTLTNTSLAAAGFGTLTLAGIETASLTGGASANVFTVSGWTGAGTFAGGGGGDTIAATRNVSFTLADSGLQASDGMNLSLNDEFTIANLTGGAAANTFNVGGWTHTGTLVGGGATADTIVAIKDADFTLTNTGLHTSDGMNLALSGNFATANLTGGVSENTFTVSEWTRAGTFAGGGGDDTIVAIKDSNFTLTNTHLQTTDGMSLTLNSNFTTANLTGGASANAFIVSGWTHDGALSGGGGGDTIAATKNVDFTISNSGLHTTDGMNLSLNSDFTIANLTGGAAANSFTVSGWTGTGTINGMTSAAGTFDQIVAVHDADMTLTNTSLVAAGFGTLTLAGLETASLTGGASANVFNVSGWTRAGSLAGGGGGDTIAATKNANFTLADSGLQTSDGMNLSLDDEFATANLTGGAGANIFNVGGWSHAGTLTGGGGADSIVATKDADFTISNTGLHASDGLNLVLSGTFMTAKLTGGASANTFTVSDWTRAATLTGGGGADTIAATKDTSFTLSNTKLQTTDGMAVTLNSDFTIANLTGGASANTFTVSGWTHEGALVGGGGGDTIAATKNADFTITNNRLQSSDGLNMSLNGDFTIANLTGGASANSFTVSGWTGSGTINGLASAAGTFDRIVAVHDADMTLTNTSLVAAGFGTLALAGIETASLMGGASANVFNVSGWTRAGTLAGGGGGDTIASTKNLNFTLSNSGLQTSDGMNLSLDSEFTTANLTGGTGANTFNVSGWTHAGTLVGGGGADTLVAVKNSDFTLSNSALQTTDGMNLSLLNGDFTTANLTGGASANTFTVSGWTRAGSFMGGGGGDTIAATKDLGFTLSNTKLQATDGLNVTLNRDFTIANLTGGASANTFTVGGWTRAGALVGGGGGDTIAATKNTGFTISNSGLQTTDGMNLSLNSDFTIANLTGGASANTFIVSGWTGGGLLSGLTSAAGTFDLIVAVHDANMTLTNTSLAAAGFGTLTLAGIETANLSGGEADNQLIANQFTLGSVTLQGNGGNDVLVGGSQKDSLDGGAGRDLLIGGPGADSIIGGTGEDILVGGTTTASGGPGAAPGVADVAAMNAIMAEWTRTGADSLFGNRIANIRAGVGPNGTRLNEQTVQNDANAIDNLKGDLPAANNTDLDWFFRSPGDVLDAISGEVTTVPTP